MRDSAVTRSSVYWTVVLAFAALLVLCGCCASAEPEQSSGAPEPSADESQAGAVDETERDKRADEIDMQGEVIQGILLTIDGQDRIVTLDTTDAARAFAELLPLELNMHDVNGNEKFASLDSALPAGAHAPGRIEAGDLMLYGDSGLVLFYESFDSPYSYTRIGRVEDPSEADSLANAESVHVIFERL